MPPVALPPLRSKAKLVTLLEALDRVTVCTRSVPSSWVSLLTLLMVAPLAYAETCQQTSLPAIQEEVMCVICGVPLVNAGGPGDQYCDADSSVKGVTLPHPGKVEAAMPSAAFGSLIGGLGGLGFGCGRQRPGAFTSV